MRAFTGFFEGKKAAIRPLQPISSSRMKVCNRVQN